MTTRLVVALTVAVALVGACAGSDAPEPGAVDSGVVTASVDSGTVTASDEIVLVDSGQSTALAGADGWNYHRSALVDVDADGDIERVVIAVRVAMVRGRPAWDDGHQWQVYVEEADSSRTVVYARRLQLGTLTLRIETGAPGKARHLVLVEHLPDRLAVYEVEYRGPTEVNAAVRYQRALDPTGELASPLLP